MIHDLSRAQQRAVPGDELRGAARHAVRVRDLRLREGAFTGAHDRKPGRLEMANDGTLFLDEIGDLSIVAQAKLLRVLEERAVRAARRQPDRSQVDFRLISATNRPLDLFVRDERFREDLFYRVNAFSIRLPALRERPVDIPVLAQRFVARYCATNGLPLDGKVSRQGRDRPARQLLPGPATSASSRAPCRARRLLARGGRFAAATSSSRTPGHRPRPRNRTGSRRCGSRARPYPPRAGERRLEQEGGGAGPRHQPRHALPESRGIRARAVRVLNRHQVKPREIGDCPQPVRNVLETGHGTICKNTPDFKFERGRSQF
mgnify:CR=1 FL=1